MNVKDIDRNSKEYREAAWFINRLIGLNTLSYVELVRVCEYTALLAKNLDVQEKIYTLEL